jgi:hypothetical protein
MECKGVSDLPGANPEKYSFDLVLLSQKNIAVKTYTVVVLSVTPMHQYLRSTWDGAFW